MSLFKKLKRQRLPIALLALVIGLAFSSNLSALVGQPSGSVEVAIAEHSPAGPAGGAVVPASCPSYAHPGFTGTDSCPTCGCTQIFGQVTGSGSDGNGNPFTYIANTCDECPTGQVANADHTACVAPSAGSCLCAANAGTSCTASNACSTLSGTIQCDGSCSVSTPTLPTGYGNSCTSTANSCGQTNSGTIQCDGGCSASTPPDSSCPVSCTTTGQSCVSSPNSCGQTNTGTVNSNCLCSATPPPDSNCPVSCTTTGQSCVSSPNSCGQTNTGTMNSSCICSATPPPDSNCSSNPPNPPNPPPSSGDVHITAPSRVRINTTAPLTWWANNVTGCSLSGPNTSDSATPVDGSTIPTRQTTSAPITGQSIFTVTCQTASGTISASATVNLIPNTQEI